MRYLVFNTKGGCGKSLVAREVIAAPQAADIVVVEIDKLNTSQSPYKNSFKKVIQLTKNNVEEILIHMNDHDNIVIDVGTDDITAVYDKLVAYDLLELIDKVIIPLMPGTQEKNALNSYNSIKKYCKNIMFAFVNFNDEEPLKDQFPIFLKFIKEDFPDFSEKDYVEIRHSDIFRDAQHQPGSAKLVTELAREVDYVTAALTARKQGDLEKFRDLMKQELHKRAARVLVRDCIMPAHKKIIK